MAKVKIWGFRCERCGHEWAPREPEQAPTVCPKCKSPYWNRPRREYCVTCKWQAHELDAKTVTYSFAKNKKTGVGRFSANALEDGKLQITIIDAHDADKVIKLAQADADSIATHFGEVRFKCTLH